MSPPSPCARTSLHQTVLHSGGHLSWTDPGNLGGLNRAADLEGAARGRHRAGGGAGGAGLERPPARAGGAAPRTAPGQARHAITALHAIPRVKHVFVVDDDVDVFSDEEMEWAMATRFRADRDLVVASGLPGFYADPSADAARTVAKAGFDLTRPVGEPDKIENRRAFCAPHRPCAAAPSDGAAGARRAGRCILRRSWMRWAAATAARSRWRSTSCARREAARLDDGEWTLKTDVTT